ncbi:MAG: sodium-dependent transporter [Propionibacteriaceae bacterium]|jgi:NSS family neurotransmitter:Na+ symporter|nr:sodium-dependent transporter [Propionibacteriaceae bacterium]
MTQDMNPAAATRKSQLWSGQFGFIIAAIGSAVGLGNIWRFPGVAYSNGGGAFMIPYLFALITAGIPILFLDYVIGHRYQGSAPLAFRRIKSWLEPLGWFQVMICFFIALYYAVILAWAASFFVFSFSTAWGADPTDFFYNSFLQMPETPTVSIQPVPGVMIPLIIIWVVSIAVLALGVTKGVEKANIIFLPLLVVAFLILVVRAIFLPGALDGLNALFTPDFDALLKPEVWISAYSQIFFSLSIAFGIMITYASYRKRKANQTAPGLVVAFANSSFELLAGIGVFSVLGFMAAGQPFAEFSANSKITGPGLSFITFPKVISEMPGGWFFGALFFGSLLMAGFTSMISITQVVSSAFQDKFKMKPAKASITTGSVIAVISIVLFGTTTGMYVLDIVDNWANNIGIVLSAILMILGCFWVLRKQGEFAYHLSSLSTFKVGRIWSLLLTWLAPLLLGYMLVQVSVGILTNGYDGYPDWMVNVFGWGQTLVCVVGALVFTKLKWPFKPDDFQPWPVYVKEELR